MKRGTPEHPKTHDLARVLGISHVQAVGHLELLWHWTARFSPAGDIGKWTNAQIAKGSEWEGNPDAFVSGLVQTKLADVCTLSRLVVHDWHDHADDSVRKYIKRNDVQFASRNVQTCRDKSRLPEPLPEPEPLPQPLPDASVCVFDATNLNAKQGARELIDEQWSDFRAVARDRDVLPGGTTDWEHAWHAWKILDPDQKERACVDIKVRPQDSPELEKSLPQNYIRGRKWERPMRQQSVNGISRAEEAKRRYLAK